MNVSKYQKLLISGLIFISLSALADVRVNVLPTVIYQGEQAQLSFISDTAFEDVPNLEGLRPYFSIIGPMNQKFHSNINGVQQTQHGLIYTLIPKKTGNITVSDITYKGEKIDPLTIQIAQTPTSDVKSESDIRATVSADAVYPGQSFVYTVIAEMPDNVSNDIRLEPPVVSSGQVIQLNGDTQKLILKNQRRLWQLTRRFLIIPDSSESIRIEPAVLQGALEIQNQQAPRSLPDLFDAGILFEGFSPVSLQPFVLKAPAVSVQIRKKPKEWTGGWWLPAESVSLSEESSLPVEVTVGDPIERVVVLKAVGVTGEQLPLPDQSGSEVLKIYPNSPERTTDITPADVPIGYLRYKMALVPMQAGEIQIPGISVLWFDTQKKQIKRAELPAKTIRVLPNLKKGTNQNKMLLKGNESVKAVEEKQTAQFDQGKHQNHKQKEMPFQMAGMFLLGIVMGVCIVLGIHSMRLKKKKNRSLQRSGGFQKKKKSLPDLYPF